MAKTTTAAATTAGDLSVRALRASLTILGKTASVAWSTIGEIEYRIIGKIFRGWG
jgi:hypothetical protein